MKLRFAADRRALVWSLLLFPALPVCVFMRPALGPWLLPAGLYLAYCAGVLTHNHQHAPVFISKRMSSAYSAWLSFFYGCPVFVWLPTHNQNHHRYLDGPGDVTRTSQYASGDTLWTALSYPTRSAIAQAPGIWAYVAKQRARGGHQYRQIWLETATVALGHAGALLFAVWLDGPARGAFTYAFALGIPALFAAWSMMFTNYVQHVGCDSTSADNHSRNFVSPWLNWLVFHAGYHTVHHEHATAHWSTYPALHAARAQRILPALNQQSIFGYCWKRYVRSGTARQAAARGDKSEGEVAI
jgi:fatty acid desaturase